MPNSCTAVALVVTIAFAALAAHAQTPAPITLPKSPCVKSEDYPGRLASERRLKDWQASYNEYGACVKKHVEELRAISAAALKASNDAVEEFNAYNKRVQEATQQ